VIAKAERGQFGLGYMDTITAPFRCPPAGTEGKLAKTQDAIAQACRLEPTIIRDVRTSTVCFTPHVLSLLHQWQYRLAVWSVAPEDWLDLPLFAASAAGKVQNG